MNDRHKVVTSAFAMLGGHFRYAFFSILLNRLIASVLIPERVRWRFYRAAGLDASRSLISFGCFMGGRAVSIGEDSFVNTRTFIEASAPVAIGRRVSIGMDTAIITSGHETGDSARRAGVVAPRPVHIDDGCWLGARVLVLPGVTIGEGCVIAAGAVVTRDCQPHGLYAGVPARRVRDLPVRQDAPRIAADFSE